MRYTLLPIALLCGLQMACGSKPPPPAEPPPEPAPEPAEPPPPPPPAPEPEKADVNISDDILSACGISVAEAHFDYNSANVKPAEQRIIQKLADCFSTGKLKGRTMRVVGHADPRGEDEYNMVLGGRRADNFAQAVSRAGLSSSQVQTTSRGEMDATGSSEASWAKDRRVDILLAD